MKLQPADVVISYNDKNDPFSIIKCWALGNRFDHVRMFFGEGYNKEPVFYESVGRGVILTSAYDCIGQKVVVMRLDTAYQSLLNSIIKEAWEIVTDEQSYYDYACYVNFIIPRLICTKLGIPIPIKYHRDPYMVCSEAVAEPFWRVNLEVLSKNIVPLPGDFFYLVNFMHFVCFAPIEESWFLDEGSI